MLQPKIIKYKKQHKGRNRGIAANGNSVDFGEYVMKSLKCARISAKQIEAARKAINKYVRRNGKMWIRIFPDKPITRKPIECRQGKGKGNVEYWVALVQSGKILFELEGVSEFIAKNAFKLASAKLPVKVIFVKRVIF